jgi:peptidyl-prolyl cis-trans isomerase B (cyclophilin B)
MRKVFMLLAISLLISGCSLQQEAQKTDAGTETDAYASTTGTGTSNAKMPPVPGLTQDGTSPAPVATPPATSQQTNNEQASKNNSTNMQNIDPTKFEKLVEQYSQAVLKTNLGDITIELYGKDSPNTVNNFLNLAKLGFYNDTKFHRVIKDFMIQGGDPNSKSDDWATHGMGGPGYRFQDEFNQNKLVRGSLAMANSGPDTNGSQFFIVTAPETPWLDGKHVNFGKITAGMDVVDKIEAVKTNQNDHPLADIVIKSIELKK